MEKIPEVSNSDGRPGLFLVFEGLDGSGKTTQAQLLNAYLKSQGYNTVLLLNRKATPFMLKEIQKLIYDLKNSDWYSPVAHVYLSASYFTVLSQNIVRPALREGKIVIVDRYYYSTIVYSAVAGLRDEWLLSLRESLIKPDLVIFLRLSPQIAIKRRPMSEDLAFHQQADRAYEWLFAEFSDEVCTVQVEAKGDIHYVEAAIRQTLEGLL